MNTDSKKIEWSSWEYEYKEQSKDWYWALGVIVVTGSIASILLDNIFFALILIVGGLTMVMFSIQKPGIAHYELNDKGFLIKDRLYPYEDIKSFWVQKESETKKLKPTLFLMSKRIFMPMLAIPIEPYHGDKIRDWMLSKNIPEQEMQDHIADRVMEYIGF